MRLSGLPLGARAVPRWSWVPIPVSRGRLPEPVQSAAVRSDEGKREATPSSDPELGPPAAAALRIPHRGSRAAQSTCPAGRSAYREDGPRVATAASGSDEGGRASRTAAARAKNRPLTQAGRGWILHMRRSACACGGKRLSGRESSSRPGVLQVLWPIIWFRFWAPLVRQNQSFPTE